MKKEMAFCGSLGVVVWILLILDNLDILLMISCTPTSGLAYAATLI